MRLTSIAAAILILALGGYSALNSIAFRANAAPRPSPQGAERGPMGPAGGPPPGSQNETAPQPPQELPQSENPIGSTTSVVNVFATVRDKHNAIVGDLTQDDFKIYEDGVPQKVIYFSRK